MLLTFYYICLKLEHLFVGIGSVNAMEILSEFPGEELEPLKKIR